MAKTMDGFRPVYATGGESATRAFIFRSRADHAKWAVTTQRAGDNLPPVAGGWEYVREFALGVREPMPVRANPEPVLRALKVRGYFVSCEGSNPMGTSQ